MIHVDPGTMCLVGGRIKYCNDDMYDYREAEFGVCFSTGVFVCLHMFSQ